MERTIEMKNKAITITGISMLLISVFLAVGVKVIFHACGAKDDGSFMHCHDAENTVMYIGIGMAVLSLAGIFIKNKTVSVILSCLSAAAAVVAALIPQTIIKMCMMNTMRCHSVMRPAVIVTCAVFAVCAVMNIIQNIRSKD